MKRSCLLVWSIVCVVGTGFLGCSTKYVDPEGGGASGEEGDDDDDGAGGSKTQGQSAGTKAGKGGAGGGGTKATAAGGKESGDEDDDDGEASSAGGVPNGAGGAKATTGGSKAVDAGLAVADGAVGVGGRARATDASAGAGGARPDGGAAAKGGGGGSGGASGASGTGGSSTVLTEPTKCTFSWTPGGSATYTTYSFSQGTAQTNGKYQTACGYQSKPNQADVVANIAVERNFAAIPGKSSQDFDTKDRCGACVQIGSAIITIIDECPYDNGNQPCKNNPTGHLDLSSSAAGAAGVQGDPNKQQAKWSYVPCPVNGNVVVRLKSGNNNEIFIENTIMPIKSVTCGSQNGSRTNYGAWHFDGNLNGCTMTLTDAAGRSIQVKAGTTQDQNVDTGVQFPKCL